MKNLKDEIIIPGSKSYTNRALFLAAMTKGKVKIINPLISDDTASMINCLEILGIKILKKKTYLEVVGDIFSMEDKKYKLDANLSGTTIRFILALCVVTPGEKILSGKPELNKRPVGDLVDALRQLGAKITYLEKEGYPPLKIEQAKIINKTFKINGSVSSQYLSAILMIAPVISGLIIEVVDNQISKPYIDMTIDIMKKFGVLVVNKNYKKYIVAKNQKYNCSEYEVEGDYSSAGYFLAIAALNNITLKLKNLRSDSKQADKKLLEILEKMGSKILYEKNAIIIKGNGVKEINIDVSDFPDQAQTLAVLASFAKGKTKLSGVTSLRIKETERVVALQNELKKINIKTLATKDSLTIFGGDPKPAKIDTYGDHRMAMSFAIAKTKLPEIIIKNPEVVNKTFPGFWKEFSRVNSITEKISKTNVVLIGMRGSGKTTIGKILAKKLRKQFVDFDQELEKRLKMKTVEIVKKYGWNYFREQEEFIVQRITYYNSVIATGGGVILRQKNIDALKKDGVFVYLKADPETLVSRIGNENKRPALTKGSTAKNELDDVFEQRKNLYKNFADVIIATDTKNKIEVVEQINENLKGLIL